VVEITASVVVPVLNGEDTIGDLLIALTHQRGVSGNYELIIVDNGSTDNTREIVGAYEVMLLHEPKRGPSAARNWGLYHASGEVIAYLDADTIPTRTWLREICLPFQDPGVLIVSGKTISYHPSTPAERFIARMGALKPEYNFSRKVFPFMASRNLAVRRYAALEIGGWAEDMHTAEDMDFCTRIRKSYNTEIVFQPTAVVFHQDRSTDEELQRQTWSYGKGLAVMYLRHPQEATWSMRNSLQVAGTMLKRAIHPEILRVGGMLGLARKDQIEYYRYLRLWSWWYWRGFFSMYRGGERKQL